MIIRGEKVKLRPIVAADVESLIRWSRDPRVNQYLEGDYPNDPETADAWFRQLMSNRHNKRWAILTHDDRLIGDIELDHITWRSREAELRICIGEPAYWNKGYGTDAVSTLLHHAFMELTLERIYLRVFTENRRAIRCYEKAGFTPEGRIQRPDRHGVNREVLLMCHTRKAFERSLGRTSNDNDQHLTA